MGSRRPPGGPVVGSDAPSPGQILLRERDPATGRLSQGVTGDRHGKGRSREVRSRWVRVGVPVVALVAAMGVGTAVLASGGGSDETAAAPTSTTSPGVATTPDVTLAGTWQVLRHLVSLDNPVAPFPANADIPDAEFEWSFEGPCDGEGACSVVANGTSVTALAPTGDGYTGKGSSGSLDADCPFLLTDHLTIRITRKGFRAELVSRPDRWESVHTDGNPCWPHRHTYTFTSVK